jgi:hypothetical protein
MYRITRLRSKNRNLDIIELSYYRHAVAKVSIRITQGNENKNSINNKREKKTGKY